MRHPFFKDVVWDDVDKCKLKPPIVPLPKKKAKESHRIDSYPLDLLNCNFDKATIRRDIKLYAETEVR